MPQWNECGIYDEACRNRTCSHPTNLLREAAKSAAETDVILSVTREPGTQCRTMLSQRPCGMHVCTRPECKGSQPVKNGTMEPVSVSETANAPQPLKTLPGLSERDLETLARALSAYRLAAPVGMDYRHVDTLRGSIVDLWLMP